MRGAGDAVVGAPPLTMLKWLRLIHDDTILLVTVGGGMVVRMTDSIDGGRATWEIDSESDELKEGVGGDDKTVECSRKRLVRWLVCVD